WPGTFVLVSVKVEPSVAVELESIMSELRERAQAEIERKGGLQRDDELYIGINNLFGPRAEDKDSAVRVRDKRVMPALTEGKSVLFDFADVRVAPHSFLGALLATPAQILGTAAY